MRGPAVLGAALFCALSFCLAPTPASADALVDQAKEAYERADFEEALSLLEMAEGATELSRDDLAEMLLTRAMVRFALGDEEGMNGDLRRLASLDPQRVLPGEVPPSIRDAFGRVGTEVDEGLRLEGGFTRTERGVLFEMAVDNDVGGLVRRTGITCRVDGGAPERGAGTSLEVAAEADANVTCTGQAFGPGRALLTELSRDVTVSRNVAADGVVDDGGLPVWPFVVGGVVLVGAAIAIIVAVVLGGGSEQMVFGPTPEP